MSTTRRLISPLIFASLACAAWQANAQAVDAAAAEQLLSTSKCTKCHSLDKQKDGPSFKKIATNYKGQKDAEAKLVTHMTTAPMVAIDGTKEEHLNIKSTDQTAIKNVARFILSR